MNVFNFTDEEVDELLQNFDSLVDSVLTDHGSAGETVDGWRERFPEEFGSVYLKLYESKLNRTKNPAE